jgi:hypothetical protein
MAVTSWTIVDALMVIGGTVAAPVWAVLLSRAVSTGTAPVSIDHSIQDRTTMPVASPVEDAAGRPWCNAGVAGR